MKVYHISETLHLGDKMNPDFQNLGELALPFVQALEKSEDCFYSMILNGKYLRAVLGKFNFWEWSDYCKWAVEGAFEFIRKTEFPNCCSRLKCNYFYDDLENSMAFYQFDWGSESPEVQEKIHLLEIELEDDAPQKFDMNIFDEAYNAMCEHDDVTTVINCARRYFSGENTSSPVLEIMSDKPAKATKDLTNLLKK